MTNLRKQYQTSVFNHLPPEVRTEVQAKLQSHPYVAVWKTPDNQYKTLTSTSGNDNTVTMMLAVFGREVIK